MSSAVLLPTLTALIGLGAFIVGIHSFVTPASAAQIYGVDLLDEDVDVVPIRATATAAATADLASKKIKKTDDGDKPKSRVLQDGRQAGRRHHLAYSLIHSLGIRNLVIGLTILILTCEWQFGFGFSFGFGVGQSSTSSSPAERAAMQKCLGIVISVGALTPIVDAVFTWRAGAGRQGRRGDVVTTVGSRKAALLHAVRSLFWLAGGLWCLSGNT
ncbi:hypothetical protein LTR47_000556 [Exophiala xenobiotica]|nr:hypothetical protein LTR41_007031 [Exophiala xenobiotica]KAK5228115.1 hypothetical protein LTR72_001998 [Exophiala xenobiotica]KAK5238813.1 hypothetical protein LTR47_000556 [Exophiala xenobiotica]KAK5255735.1 hypothetical protein LTS06_000191 [Exophiala xenobiotica]KAK5261928.1 hypothetical protein LTR40_001307 [Exophiala xenobiotica]